MTNLRKDWLSTFIIAFALFLPAQSFAEDEDVATLLKDLTGTEPKLIRPAKIDGFSVVQFEDLSVMYVSNDLKWIFQGELTEISRENGLKLISHTEMFKNVSRKTLLDSLDPENLIAFAPPLEASRSVVHVFTDTTCGYCQKLHAEINDYHQKGIEIRYLAYPRAGVGSEPYDQMVSAWCSDNPRGAITRLKQRLPIENLSCKNPVSEHYILGQQMGLRGTPLMVLSNGKTVGGYVNADELEKILKDEGLL